MAGFRLSKGRGWDAARKRFENSQATLKKKQLLALKRAGTVVEKEVKLRLARSVGMAPLRPITVLLRRGGSSRPLMDTGALLGSVSTKLDEPGMSVFVGVLRNAHGPGGEGLMNLALIHEYGTKPYAIAVTEGMRRLFVALYLKSQGAIKPLRKDKTIIMHPGVPARPFLRPALEAAREKISREIQVVISGGVI